MKARAKRKPVTTSRSRSAAAAKRQPRGEGNKEIVLRAPALPEHRYALNRDQVELLKRTIAKGATDDELQLFLQVAKRHRLDPFTRQLHLIKRWVKSLINPDGSKGGYVATIQIGIDGYRQMASRYGDFGSVSEANYGPMKQAGKYKVPEWAQVKVYKKGLAEPSVGVAYWDEYAPYDLEDSQAFMWRKMPRHMLAKCAEALALRKAHPDLADIYTTDEMARTNMESTAGGRQIAQPDDCRYCGRQGNFDQCLEKICPKRSEAAMPLLTPAQLEVAKQKMAELTPKQILDLGENPVTLIPSKDSAKLTGTPDDGGRDSGKQPEAATAEVLPNALYWLYRKQTQDYEIMGSETLKHDNRELLVPLYDKKQKKILCDAAGLGKLISQFERLKVPFREWGAMREPGE